MIAIALDSIATQLSHKPIALDSIAIAQRKITIQLSHKPIALDLITTQQRKIAIALSHKPIALDSIAIALGRRMIYFSITAETTKSIARSPARSQTTVPIAATIWDADG